MTESKRILAERDMQMVNHWAKATWYSGRPFYSWFLTFERCPELHDLASRRGELLKDYQLDVVPVQWLHLTMQSIGAADRIAPNDVRRIGEAAQTGCAAIAPFDIRIGRVVVHPEAVVMLATPLEPILRLRRSLRDAIASVRPADAVLNVEGDDSEGFIPHVTLAYSRSDGMADSIIEAIRIDKRSVDVRVTDAQLLLVERQIGEYRWSTISTASLIGSRAW